MAVRNVELGGAVGIRNHTVDIVINWGYPAPLGPEFLDHPARKASRPPYCRPGKSDRGMPRLRQGGPPVRW